VDSFPEMTGIASRPSHSLLGASPLAFPENATNVGSLCSEIESFAQLLEKSLPSLPAQAKLNCSRRRAREIVRCLSIEECRYLLQTWLLSLTMCDLSFFVSFTTDDGIHVDLLNEQPADDGRCRVLSPQQHGSPGRLAYCSSPSHAVCDGVLLYELKAIDFDRKPARKLRARHLAEAYFDTTETDHINASSNA
jgi:hypothetical protein